jgi:fructose-bisphosphate aldolase, class I
MFALMPKMRSRIIASPRFGGDRILGAILFENTLDREIHGRESAEYLWTAKNVVPFVKVDKGLVEEFDGVQVMKPMPDLDALRARPSDKGVFGTKVRSVIKRADDCGVKSVVDQQFDVARRILQAGLAPIIEPKIDIHSPQKAEAEALLKAVLLEQLRQLASDQYVMSKLTLPELNDFYRPGQAPETLCGSLPLCGGNTTTRRAPVSRPTTAWCKPLTGPHRGPLGPAER